MIKVFIVEDSILMQKIIADILSTDPEISVVGKARSGKDALEKIPKILPDVVTLDVNLSDISGIEVLKELMEKFPTRVVMLSAYTQRETDLTLKALELGALDFIPKPSGEISLDLYNFKDEIINKIKLVSEINIEKVLNVKERRKTEEELRIKKIVIIGASTGGPKAISEIIANLSSPQDATFLIVQHIPPGFTKSFAQRLSWIASFKIKEAEDKDILKKNAGYVAASGFHMMIEKENTFYRIRLDETKLVNYVRPSVDVTMKSVAEVFDGEIIGVILTGMGKDGLEGARAVKKKNGKIIVQDESTSVVYGMPKVIAENNLADFILPLSQIPKKLEEYLNG